jgi:hypothetical protein|tara:strand:+ start:272 stop:457 length:186 start_codon:yes stop_codon:yes gene_type:complete
VGIGPGIDDFALDVRTKTDGTGQNENDLRKKKREKKGGGTLYISIRDSSLENAVPLYNKYP